MNWTAEQLKWITYYSSSQGLRMSLGGPPYARFVNHNGKEEKIHINTVHSHYAKSKKEEQKARARRKAQEAKQNQILTRYRSNNK